MAMTFGTLDFAVAFNRQTAFPLDAKSYFESLELATAAAASAQEAGSSETTYYYGQTVAVVESGKATLYVIQPDNTLKEVGGNIVINENVFAKDADGSLNLLGFADAVAGAQLVKSADGKVSWVKPDATTVEGLQTAVSTLQTTIGDENSGLVKQVNDNSAAIEILNGNNTTEGSVAYQIAQVVAGADASYDTLKEIADWISTHGTDAAAMNTQITTNKNGIAALKTQVGTEPVATQISTAIDAALKVDGADKYALASHTHEIGNITGLQDVLNSKAAASDVTSLQSSVDGLTAKAHEHSNKTILDSISEEKIAAWDAAQANTIESIKLNGTVVTPSEDKSVNISIPNATSEVSGLVKIDDVTIKSTDGVIGVKAISTDLLEQGTQTLIFNCGNA